MSDVTFPPFPEDLAAHTIVADPPWRYRDTLPGNKGAADHYDTLTPEQVSSLGPDVQSVSADSAHLYLWCTSAFMEDAHTVARSWGFQPKTLLTWVKVEGDTPPTLPHEREDTIRVSERMGMGRYFRNSCEYILFATKDNRPLNRQDLPGIVFANRREHSSKPNKTYRLFEAASDGPYFEMFSRGRREGWYAWGKEAETTEPSAAPSVDRGRTQDAGVW